MGNKVMSKQLVSVVKNLAPYLFISLVTVIAYFSLHGLLVRNQVEWIHFGMFSCLMTLGFGLFYLVQKKAPIYQLIIGFILCGIVLRIGYMSYTWYFIRGHDVFFGDNGHIDYVKYLMSGELPPNNNGQFYHPPLQHFLESIVGRMTLKFQVNWTTHYIDVVKVIPTIESCSLLVVCYRICQEAKLSEKATVIIIALLSFHPVFIILAGSINNDMGMIFFFMLAILATIRWYNRPSYHAIIWTALWIGCSMMTKISGGMVALFTGPVFLLVLIQTIRRNEKSQIFNLIKQFIVFALICFPLGLWYPIRNYLNFEQPFNYVYLLEREWVPDLYNGDVSWIQRFIFSRNDWLRSSYAHVGADDNIWLFAIKSSLFGESAVENRSQVVAWGLLVTGVVLVIISLFFMIYTLKKGKEIHPLIRFGFFDIWIVQVGMFIVFNKEYPFRCTMDARYLVPTIIVGIFYYGIGVDLISGKEKNKKIGQTFTYLGYLLVLFFIIFSALFYA